MFHRFRSTVLAVSACSALAIGQAAATTITTTAFNNWTATLTGSPTEADLSAIQYSNYNTTSGLLLTAIGNSSIGFTVTGPDNGAYSLAGVNYTGYKSLEGSSDSGASVDIATPASGENALLLSFATSNSTPVYVLLSDGETFIEGKGLFGISISHPITSLNLSTDAGSQVIIDDLWYGTSSLAQDASGGTTSSTTPEGATLLMIPGGLLFLFGAIRRLRGAAEIPIP